MNFFPVLPKVFASQCIRCSRILVPDDHPRLAKSLKKATNYKNAVKQVFAETTRYRTCWFPSGSSDSKLTKAANRKQQKEITGDEEPEEEEPHMLSPEEAKKRGYCGAKQPDLWIRDEDVLIRPTYYISDPADFDILPKITPRHLYNMLKFASDSTTRIFGFDPIFSPLHCMMVENLLVPPLIIRPTRSAHGAEDDLTKTLRNIQEHNTNAQRDVLVNLTLGLKRTTENLNFTPTVARKKMERIQGPMSTRLLRKKIPVVPVCLDDYFLVQRAAACLWDSKYHKNLDAEYGRDPFSLKRRFAPGKRSKGRMRQSMLGKRGDFTIRGVATPNPNLDIDEVELPRHAAMHLTWPERVNALNFDAMLKLVINGQFTYPGCNYIERDGVMYLPGANHGGLRIGDVVHRHFVQGDWVICNRQPSLHKFAIMGYRVQVSPDDIIGNSLCITTVLGLDFDGDEMNIYAPQNLLERAEIAHLMNVCQNMMKDGKLMIGFVQHAVLGAFKLTEETTNVILTQDEVAEYLLVGKNETCIVDTVARWDVFNERKQLTGREFMHVLLPTYTFKPGSPALTKTTLNACLGSTIESNGDMEYAGARLGFLTRILERFCSDCGVSIHLDDCNVSKPPQRIQDEANEIFKDACDIAADLERSLRSETKSQDREDLLVSAMDEEEAEEDICKLTGDYRNLLGDYAVKKLRSKQATGGTASGMCDIVDSRSKGTEVNITQNVIVIGQQMNENSMRYKDSTSHYYRNVLARYGFVPRSFLDGMTPTELFFHLRASRIGLISTACQTSDSGYLYRKLFKSVEDERVSFDNSIRNAVNDIILFEYGFDTTFLHPEALRTVTMTIREVVDAFITEKQQEEEDDDPCCIDEVERLLMLREQVIELEPKLYVSIPVRFDKKFTCTEQCCMRRGVSNNAARNRIVHIWIHLTTKCRMMSSPSYELMFFEQMATRMLKERGMLQCPHVFKQYLEYVQETFATNICAVGSPAGMDAAQSCTQPLTQTGLKRFHITGEKTTIVSGVTRLREIINLVKRIERPLMYVYLLPEFEDTFDPMEMIELRLSHVVSKYHDLPVKPCNEPDMIHLSLYLQKTTMEKRMLSPREVAGYLLNTQIMQLDPGTLNVTYSELSEDVWWITLSLKRTSKILLKLGTQADVATMPSPLLSLKLQHALIYDKQILAGITGIRDFALIEKEVLESDELADEKLIMRKRKCYLTMGSNLQAVCALPGIDLEHTTSNDIHQVFQVYGVDAAQLAIELGLMEAMQTSEASVAQQHIKLIAATICFGGTPAALTFSGMTKSESSQFKRATFERSLESFIGAGVCGHVDQLRGVSEAIVCGTVVSLGSGGDFRILPSTTNNVTPPTQPKRKRFDFQVPNISEYIKPKTQLSDDAITLDLNPMETIDGNNIQHNKRMKKNNEKKQVLQEPGFSHSRRGTAQILRPSSPLAIVEHASFGSLNLLVPSSPKTRKRSEKRKLRQCHIDDDNHQPPLTDFFSSVTTCTNTASFTSPNNKIWKPSSP